MRPQPPAFPPPPKQVAAPATPPKAQPPRRQQNDAVANSLELDFVKHYRLGFTTAAHEAGYERAKQMVAGKISPASACLAPAADEEKFASPAGDAGNINGGADDADEGNIDGGAHYDEGFSPCGGASRYGEGAGYIDGGAAYYDQGKGNTDGGAAYYDNQGNIDGGAYYDDEGNIDGGAYYDKQGNIDGGPSYYVRDYDDAYDTEGYDKQGYIDTDGYDNQGDIDTEDYDMQAWAYIDTEGYDTHGHDKQGNNDTEDCDMRMCQGYDGRHGYDRQGYEKGPGWYKNRAGEWKFRGTKRRGQGFTRR